MKKNILVLIFLCSCIITSAFSELSKLKGVVTDSFTSLQWQDNYYDNKNSIKTASWSEAISYCRDLALDNKNDWRLPNINELLSLVDYQKYNSYIKGDAFVNTSELSSGYWSSTTDAYTNSNAWVLLSNSIPFPSTKISTYNIRCVRAGE